MQRAGGLSRILPVLRILQQRIAMGMRSLLIAVSCAAGLLGARNVCAQTAGKGPDSIGYARLGYGAVFGDRTYGGPSVGFGYRAEFETFAVDVSFLNLQLPSSGSSDRSWTSGSLLKLQGLHFVNSEASATTYVGAGLSLGFTNVGQDSSGPGFSVSSWRGGGLQGEFTIGYEAMRASPLRMFVEANATVPFYNVASDHTTYSASTSRVLSVVSFHRFAPSVGVSFGLGWRHHRAP